MITTLTALAAVCLLSLAFILIIPYFAATKVLMRFLPRDIREAAKAHPDPPVGKKIIGYLITALARFWLLFGRYICCSCMAVSCWICWCRISISWSRISILWYYIRRQGTEEAAMTAASSRKTDDPADYRDESIRRQCDRNELARDSSGQAVHVPDIE